MLHVRLYRLWRLLCWLGLLAATSGMLTVQAEPEPQLYTSGAAWHLVPEPLATWTPAQLIYRQYLPSVATGGAPAFVTFFGRMGDLRSGPATQFEYGITALEYEVQVRGAAGQPYQEEWSVDGQPKPQLGSQGTIPDSPATLTNALLYSTGAPLPRGTYQMRFLIDGFVAAQSSVVID